MEESGGSGESKATVDVKDDGAFYISSRRVLLDICT